MQLADTELFQGMTGAEIDSLLGCLDARKKHYQKGETILPEGRPTQWIGLVLAGRALISSSDAWGNNSILGSAGPGSVFAEAYACCPGQPLQSSVSAAEETEVLFLNVQRVMSPCAQACGCHTKLLCSLLGLCAHKSLELSRRILHTRAKTIRGRLMSYFSECVRSAGECRFEVPFSRQQLADYLGVDRSALCSELSKMQRDGLIRYHRSHFEVPRPFWEEMS